jgi:C_GCAxxG_C_C family probable redox protein
MKTSDRALELFHGGCNCAQSVAGAFIKDPSALGFACGFGGGIGTLQGSCGAYTGAVMALGVRMHDPADVMGSRKAAAPKIRELAQAFEARHGSTECLRLLGVNLLDPQLADLAREKDMFRVKCDGYVRSACEILESMGIQAD